jgi:large subunit ribosomal protein L6
MSRIGKLPIIVPPKVKIETKGSAITVEGPKGRVARTFAPVVEIGQMDDRIVVTPKDESRFAKAMHGTVRSTVNSMVYGVVTGFSKELEIQGVGFKAVLQGKILDLALGYSHPIKFSVPDGVKLTVTDQTKIKVEGCDKQLVGQVAAKIRSYYPPEPYKGKGVRIVGERVRRKEGKTVA